MPSCVPSLSFSANSLPITVVKRIIYSQCDPLVNVIESYTVKFDSYAVLFIRIGISKEGKVARPSSERGLQLVMLDLLSSFASGAEPDPYTPLCPHNTT